MIGRRPHAAFGNTAGDQQMLARASIAKALAAEGASVVVNYASSREGADRVVSEIKSKGGNAIAVQGDVSIASDVSASL